MTVVINGTTGVTSVNGSAAAPSVTGTDTDTGIVYGTNTLSLATGGTTAVTVDSSQNVVVGSGTAFAKLSVFGDLGSGSSASDNTGQANVSITSNTGNSSKPRAQFIVSGSAYAPTYQAIRANNAVLYSAYADLCLNADTSNNIQFWTGANERVRITSGGEFQIGYVTNAGNLVVQGNGTAQIGRFLNKAGTDSSLFGLYVGKFANDTTTSQRFIGFSINNDSNGSGQINANGASQAAFGSFSDARLKENITDLAPQLANVMSLRPVEFDYKTGGHQTGFIAQEMQQVFPDAVGDDGSEDHYLTVTGWNKTEAILVKAIQEQQAIIEQLRADVEALKAA